MYIEELGVEIPEECEEAAVEEALVGILSGEWSTEETSMIGSRFETFEKDGVITRDKGIVIKMPCGQNFQLSIVRCR